MLASTPRRIAVLCCCALIAVPQPPAACAGRRSLQKIGAASESCSANGTQLTGVTGSLFLDARVASNVCSWTITCPSNGSMPVLVFTEFDTLHEVVAVFSGVDDSGDPYSRLADLSGPLPSGSSALGPYQAWTPTMFVRFTADPPIGGQGFVAHYRCEACTNAYIPPNAQAPQDCAGLLAAGYTCENDFCPTCGDAHACDLECGTCIERPPHMCADGTPGPTVCAPSQVTRLGVCRCSCSATYVFQRVEEVQHVCGKGGSFGGTQSVFASECPYGVERVACGLALEHFWEECGLELADVLSAGARYQLDALRESCNDNGAAYAAPVCTDDPNYYGPCTNAYDASYGVGACVQAISSLGYTCETLPIGYCDRLCDRCASICPALRSGTPDGCHCDHYDGLKNCPQACNGYCHAEATGVQQIQVQVGLRTVSPALGEISGECPSNSGRHQWFRFTALQGHSYTIYTELVDGGLTSTYLHVHAVNEDQTELAHAKSWHCVTQLVVQSGTGASCMTWDSLHSGEYAIRVQQNAGSGAFRVGIIDTGLITTEADDQDLLVEVDGSGRYGEWSGDPRIYGDFWTHIDMHCDLIFCTYVNHPGTREAQVVGDGTSLYLHMHGISGASYEFTIRAAGENNIGQYVRFQPLRVGQATSSLPVETKIGMWTSTAPSHHPYADFNPDYDMGSYHTFPGEDYGRIDGGTWVCPAEGDYVVRVDSNCDVPILADVETYLDDSGMPEATSAFCDSSFSIAIHVADMRTSGVLPIVIIQPSCVLDRANPCSNAKWMLGEAHDRRFLVDTHELAQMSALQGGRYNTDDEACEVSGVVSGADTLSDLVEHCQFVVERFVARAASPTDRFMTEASLTIAHIRVNADNVDSLWELYVSLQQRACADASVECTPRTSLRTEPQACSTDPGSLSSPSGYIPHAVSGACQGVVCAYSCATGYVAQGIHSCQLDGTYQGGACVCADGWTMNERQTECVRCPDGSAGRGGHCSSCTVVSNAERTDCEACPPGKAHNLEQTGCVDCDPDEVSNGVAPCSPCAIGEEPNQDSSSCHCSPGYYKRNEMSRGCNVCHIGFVCLGGSEQPHPCAAGTQPNVEHTSCVLCLENEASHRGAVCEVCPFGKTARADQTACVCLPGYFNRSDVCVECHTGYTCPGGDSGLTAPCPAGTQPDPSRTTCVVCPDGTAGGEGMLCDACPYGEVPNGDKTTCECLPGFFYGSNGKCVECSDTFPPGVYECPGGPKTMAFVGPSAGWWMDPRPPIVSESFYWCTTQESCPGWSTHADHNCNRSNCCTADSSGPLCGSCANTTGYIIANGRCIQCPGTQWSIVFVAVLAYTALGGFLERKSRKLQDHADGSTLSIMTFYAQSLALFASDHFYGITNLLDFDFNSVSAQDAICKTTMSPYQSLAASGVLVPAYVTLISLIASNYHSRRDRAEISELSSSLVSGAQLHTTETIAGVSASVSSKLTSKASAKRNAKRIARKRRDRAILEVCMFSYMSVTKKAFTVLFCREVAGQHLLAFDLSQPCYDTRHVVAIALAASALTCITVGLPVLIILKSLKRSKRDSKIEELTTFTRVLSLFNDYATWWMAWLLFRRALLVVAFLYGQVGGDKVDIGLGLVDWRAMAFLVLVVSASLQTWYMPFKLPMDNKLEQVSLLMLTLALYADVVDTRSDSKIAAIVVLCSVVVVFVCFVTGDTPITANIKAGVVLLGFFVAHPVQTATTIRDALKSAVASLWQALRSSDADQEPEPNFEMQPSADADTIGDDSNTVPAVPMSMRSDDLALEYAVPSSDGTGTRL